MLETSLRKCTPLALVKRDQKGTGVSTSFFVNCAVLAVSFRLLEGPSASRLPGRSYHKEHAIGIMSPTSSASWQHALGCRVAPHKCRVSLFHLRKGLLGFSNYMTSSPPRLQEIILFLSYRLVTSRRSFFEALIRDINPFTLI